MVAMGGGREGAGGWSGGSAGEGAGIDREIGQIPKQGGHI